MNKLKQMISYKKLFILCSSAVQKCNAVKTEKPSIVDNNNLRYHQLNLTEITEMSRCYNGEQRGAARKS